MKTTSVLPETLKFLKEENVCEPRESIGRSLVAGLCAVLRDRGDVETYQVVDSAAPEYENSLADLLLTTSKSY